jgi:hypothetical protein
MSSQTANWATDRNAAAPPEHRQPQQVRDREPPRRRRRTLDTAEPREGE